MEGLRNVNRLRDFKKNRFCGVFLECLKMPVFIALQAIQARYSTSMPEVLRNRRESSNARQRMKR